MNTYSQQIEADVDKFQNHVQKLSISIQSAGSLWKDPQFSDLMSGISKIALQAKKRSSLKLLPPHRAHCGKIPMKGIIIR